MPAIDCPRCRSANPLDARFCVNCGASLITTCPSCATPLVPGARFCHNCGHSLAEIQPEASQARLQKYIPRELLAKLEAVRASHGMRGERRIVTILFCDVKGSTALAESLDPEEWAEIMNGAFEYLIRPIYRYEGTLARLMGDAILAFFGAPIAHEDDPQRAVRAGLDIVDGMRVYRLRVRQERGLEFDVRVGIHTGLVVVGEVGSDLRVEYTAMGDAANLAARMEQAAQLGSVQISGDTYKLVAPLFEVEPLGDVEMKGRREPVRAYRVLGRKPKPGRLRGIEGLSSPLVGRQTESDALRHAMTELRDGRGQIVCLIGEAGLGKSRLISELRAEWFAREDRQEVRGAAIESQAGGRLQSWIEGRCLSYEATHPYGQFQYLIRTVSGATETDSSDVVREKIARLSQAISPAQSARLSQVFEALLAVDADARTAPLEGEALKHRLFAVVSDMLRAWASIGPGVLALDDLHWCDPASVELLLRLLPIVDEAPILIVCALRPDPRSPAWRIRQAAKTTFSLRYTEIGLRALPVTESHRLLEALLPGVEWPPHLRDHILGKAEGNPLYVEEVVRMLVDSGALAQDLRAGEGGWRLSAAIEDVAIPDTVQALLIARIDRLEEAVRHTLHLAAVIGRSFSFRVLQMMAAMSGSVLDVEQHLQTLEQAGLIREAARTPELGYAFLSALTQEAAYNAILLKHRREYHRRVGETLEALFADRQEEQASVLAHHFDQAGDVRAPVYHSLAGDAAFRLYALAEADAHYTRALELTRRADSGAFRDTLRLYHLYTRRGRTLELRGQYDDAIRDYEDMEADAQRRGERAWELAALMARSTIHSTLTAKFDPEQAHALAARSLALARDLGDRPAEARVLWNLAVLHTFTGQLREAEDYGEQSLAIARQLDLREQLARTLNDLSHVYLLTGQRERLSAALQEAGDLWLALGDLAMLAENLANTATRHLFYGEYSQALNRSADALRVSQSIDHLWSQAYSREIAGLVYLEWGQADDAIAALQAAVELGERAGFLDALVSARTYLGLIYAYLGDVDRAFQVVGRALAQAEQASYLRAMPLAILGFLHVLKGDLGEAEALIRDAYQSLYPGISTSPAPIWVMVADAEFALARHDAARAEDLMDSLLSQLQPLGARPFILNALRLKGEALIGRGNTDAARAVLHAARAEAEALGSRRTLWPVLADLHRIEAQDGRLAEADDLRQRTRQIIDDIAGHIGEPELRASFLNMPGVRPFV